MTTLDFELEIGPGVTGSYPVVARAPGGKVATTLRWSVNPADLDHQLAVIKDKVLASSAVVHRAPTEDEQPVRELGQRLFEALFSEGYRTGIGAILSCCSIQNRTVRKNGQVRRVRHGIHCD